MVDGSSDDEDYAVPSKKLRKSSYGSGKKKKKPKRKKSSDRCVSFLEQREDEPELIEIREQLARRGLRIKDMLGDGNCLFRALGDQMEGTCANHMTHRQATVTYMEEHPADFEQFSTNGHPERFPGYCKKLRRFGEFGDHDALVAFGRQYKVKIWMHMKGKPIQSVDPTAPAEWQRELHVSYHFGNHYASVRKIGDDTNAAATVRKEECEETLRWHSETDFTNVVVPDLEFAPPEESRDRNDAAGDSGEDGDGEYASDEYDVEEIVDYKTHPDDGKQYYLIKWVPDKDGNPYEDTWEPIANVTATEKIDAFWREMRKFDVYKAAVKDNVGGTARGLKAVFLDMPVDAVEGRSSPPANTDRRPGGGTPAASRSRNGSRSSSRQRSRDSSRQRSRDSSRQRSRDSSRQRSRDSSRQRSRDSSRQRSRDSPPHSPTARQIFAQKEKARIVENSFDVRRIPCPQGVFDDGLSAEARAKRPIPCKDGGNQESEEEENGRNESESSESEGESESEEHGSNMDDFIEDDVGNYDHDSDYEDTNEFVQGYEGSSGDKKSKKLKSKRRRNDSRSQRKKKRDKRSPKKHRSSRRRRNTAIMSGRPPALPVRDSSVRKSGIKRVSLAKSHYLPTPKRTTGRQNRSSDATATRRSSQRSSSAAKAPKRKAQSSSDDEDAELDRVVDQIYSSTPRSSFKSRDFGGHSSANRDKPVAARAIQSDLIDDVDAFPPTLPLKSIANVSTNHIRPANSPAQSNSSDEEALQIRIACAESLREANKSPPARLVPTMANQKGPTRSRDTSRAVASATPVRLRTPSEDSAVSEVPSIAASCSLPEGSAAPDLGSSRAESVASNLEGYHYSPGSANDSDDEVDAEQEEEMEFERDSATPVLPIDDVDASGRLEGGSEIAVNVSLPFSLNANRESPSPRTNDGEMAARCNAQAPHASGAVVQASRDLDDLLSRIQLTKTQLDEDFAATSSAMSMRDYPLPIQDFTITNLAEVSSPAFTRKHYHERLAVSGERISPNGTQKLSCAVRAGDVELVRQIAVDAERANEALDFDQPDEKGVTLLMICALKKCGSAENDYAYHKIAEILLDYGAEFTAFTKSGFTALMAICQTGERCFLSLFLRWGQRLNARNCDFDTALTIAARNKHFVFVQALLLAGANPSHENKHRQTALMLAEQPVLGSPHIANLLRQFQIRVSNAFLPAVAAACDDFSLQLVEEFMPVHCFALRERDEVITVWFRAKKMPLTEEYKCVLFVGSAEFDNDAAAPSDASPLQRCAMKCQLAQNKEEHLVERVILNGHEQHSLNHFAKDGGDSLALCSMWPIVYGTNDTNRLQLFVKRSALGSRKNRLVVQSWFCSLKTPQHHAVRRS